MPRVERERERERRESLPKDQSPVYADPCCPLGCHALLFITPPVRSDKLQLHRLRLLVPGHRVHQPRERGLRLPSGP